MEAALYAAGRPLTIEDITKVSGLESKEKIKKILNELINKTKVVFKAIEIVRLEDGRYVFQLKPNYSSYREKICLKTSDIKFGTKNSILYCL